VPGRELLGGDRHQLDDDSPRRSNRSAPLAQTSGNAETSCPTQEFSLKEIRQPQLLQGETSMLVTSPAWQTILRVIGMQHTLQSSTVSQLPCVVSTSTVNFSQQCGHCTSHGIRQSMGKDSTPLGSRNWRDLP
jgi:hypothetical protein